MTEKSLAAIIGENILDMDAIQRHKIPPYYDRSIPDSEGEWMRTDDVLAVRCRLLGIGQQAMDESNELYYFRWMVEMRLNVVENSVVGRSRWICTDVDGEEIGSGPTALDAIRASHERNDNPTDEEHSIAVRRAMDTYRLGMAENQRERQKDGES